MSVSHLSPIPSVLRHTGNWCIYDNVFTWDIPKSIANFEEPGVPFEEAATVISDDTDMTGTTWHIRTRISGSNDSVDR